MSSADHPYSEFFEKLSQCNAHLFKSFQEKANTDSPVHKAMMQINAQDFSQWVDNMAAQPATVMQNQLKWWQDQMQIWQNSFTAPEKSVIKANKGDRRFGHPMWDQEAIFKVIKESYLLFGKNMMDLIEQASGLEPEVKERLSFFTRQVVNAMSPSNFVNTNPELLKLTLENNGENLVRGMEQFHQDLQASAEVLRVSMTSKGAFEVGKDLAITPGEVVFRNHLLELIQYHPKTEQVKQRPMFIVPPFINKYYILDMRPQNSMVNYLLEQGHTVFLISWRNPDASLSESGFDDYIQSGVIAPLEFIEELTGEASVNALAYCIGGTLLTMATAYMVSNRMKQRIKSATLLTTILDFKQPGEIGVFINEAMVSSIEMQNQAMGYMDGRALGVTFSSLRENSLYWNYYVDNYLKGQSPMDFDLLHWNSDATNITATCHNFILRELYLENKLTEPKAIKINGTGIDLAKVKVPIYFLSTKEDHIADWKTTYAGSHLLNGPVTFVLGESGHVAGVINPPYKNKYGYWAGGKRLLHADDWLESAQHHQGSWWEHWRQWLEHLDDKAELVAARQIDMQRSLCPAPGTYVQQQLPIVSNAKEADATA